MKRAFLSDIHGNAIALEACLRQVSVLGADEVYFLGDAVGYLPAAREVLDRLDREHIICQQGNHDRMLISKAPIDPKLEASYRLEQAREELDETYFQRIATWPQTRELLCGDTKLLLVHASPVSPLDGYVYPDTDLTQFHELPFDAVVMGHTHRPFVRSSGGKTFVNVGSVGLPRDRGDLAAFAMHDSDTNQFEIVRVTLDVDAILAAYGDRIADNVRDCLRR